MKSDPQNLQMLADKAAAHYKAGRFSSAEKFYLRALKGAPNHPQLLFAVATIYEELDKPAKALRFYERAIVADPNYIDARLNHGACLQGLGRLDEAKNIFSQLMQDEPGFLLAPYNLGTVLAEQERPLDAIKAFEKALDIDPALAEGWFNLGNSLHEADQNEAAISAFEKAISLRPEFTSAIVNLGVANQTLGQFEEARENFDAALAIDPNLPAAHYQMSLMGEGRGGIAVGIETIESALESHQSDDPARAVLHFAVARLQAKEKSYEQAFEHYRQANEIRAAAHPFDIRAYNKKIDRQIEIFSDANFSEKSWANSDARPVFIIGMPRSGTTLVEQIIASHAQAYGAGERSEIVRFVRNEVGDKAPDQLDAGIVQDFTANYLGAIEVNAGQATRITDKMPGNFLNLGLIAMMFPNAHIIHCRRDPLDTCLSCYFQNFSEILPFTNDLAALGHYYRGYQRLMDHWQSVLPIKIHDLVYEDMVGNVEQESQTLIAHLGLEWDPACLEFFKSERAVTTASVWQARQPVYKGSVGAWRHYKQHLAPLKEALQIT